MNNEIKNKMSILIKEMTNHRLLKKVAYGFGILLIAGIIFHSGVIVGFHKASFGRDWNDNYSRNFGPRRSRMMGMMPEDFPNAHGTLGKIVNVTLPSFIVEDRDKTEEVVIVNDTTQIKNMRTDGTKDDLKIDAYVVVIGTPNSTGQIEAKLIRILPTKK